MIEKIFKTQVACFTDDTTKTEALWEEVRTAYSKRNRHYHNLAHLEQVFFQLLPLQKDMKNWQTVVFSIVYHDVVYNPLKTDNENRSASLANERLAKIGVPQDQRSRCAEQILATKTHILSSDDDTSLFTDADLSILGADKESYKLYSKQIRKEYSWYPDIVYNPGRKKVLKHFLEMQDIFKTSVFRERYETRARLNMEAELSELA